ncbi:MAG: hypothetical protein WKF73_01585 [Nocardioidaceae bacterium]
MGAVCRDLQLLDAVELGGQGSAAQLGAQVLGRDHDQALQLVDGLGSADQNPFSASENHPQRLSQAARSRSTLLVAGERLAGRADRVDPIVLRSAGAFERTNLDDRLTGIEEEHDQAGGEAAGSFQRPDPPAGSVLAGPGEHPSIARHRRRCQPGEHGLARSRCRAPPGRRCRGLDRLR